MKNLSDADWESLRRKILGLGDTSIRKSHYASLRQRLTELEKAEQRILKLNRLYLVITQVNKAIVKVHTQKELFFEVCRLCVDCGQFRLAWIGTANETGAFTPVAWAGDDPQFVHSSCSVHAGPCADALRTGRSHFRNNLDSHDGPCEEQAFRSGYRSICAVPFRLPEDKLGILAIYSADAFFFDDEEVRLLEDVASDISFACDAIDQEQQRHRAEQDLQETNRRLRTIFEASPAAMVVMDAEGVVTAWNQAAEEVFGWSRQEVIGLPSPLEPNSGSSGFPELRIHILGEARGSAVESRRKRKDGSWVDVSVSAAPLRNSDASIAGFIAVYLDVSERKRLEAQLLQAQKMETLGRLAGGVAHDFNNLLTVVNGHADLLMRHPATDDSVAVHASVIRKAGQQGADLTRQLLAFSRTQQLQPQVVTLGKIVADIESILFRLMPEDIELTVALDSGTASVNADPAQLGQVILNLVVNARDAVGPGGKITIRTETVAIESRSADTPGLEPGEYVTLKVSDNGTGIDQETQSKMFEPFFTTKGDKGTGLGLSTVWGIIQQSGGHIRVSSELNRGSTFTVYLPVSHGVPAAEAKPEASKLPGVLRGTETLLLVDDRNDVRYLTAEILKSYGYTVLQAGTGEEALTISGQTSDISLLITDVMMPGMTGPELAKHIHATRPQMKILFVSGYDKEQDSMEHGAGFLQKPYSAIQLATSVRQVLAEECDQPADRDATNPKLKVS